MSTRATHTAAGQQRPSLGARLVRWSGIALVAASWISASIFSAYIAGFYLGNLLHDHAGKWNGNLDGLYARGHFVAVAAIATHFATGAILLLLGPVQLMASVRRRWPRFHRWAGRVYVVTALLAGSGGCLFILLRGTVGGPVMSLGFGLYGVLVVVAAALTWRRAVQGRLDVHRAWAIRLFALAIGSWLYRMDYGLWLTAAHGLGHLESFRGPFDYLMSFFFYLPNLLLVELFLRGRRRPASALLHAGASIALNLATLIVVVGTYYFTRFYWGPQILSVL